MTTQNPNGDRVPGRSSNAVWTVVTLVAWPFWHWLMLTASAYPASWFMSALPVEDNPSSPGGLFGSAPYVSVIAVSCLAAGFVGLYVLTRLGAPRATWLVAWGISTALFLLTALFWAGFSGSGTGVVNIASQFAITLLLGLAVGAGARLGRNLAQHRGTA